MYVSPTKALKMFQVSKPTLYQDMKSAKLSYTKTDKGRRQIDVAELSRVYEYRADWQEEGMSEKAKSINSDLAKSENTENFHVELLKRENDLLQEQMKFKDKMIEEWQEAFNKAQSTADKITALIEDKTGSPQKNEKIEALEKTMAELKSRNEEFINSQEQRIQEKTQLRQKLNEEMKKRRAIERALEEKSRGFFDRLFKP